MRFSFATLAKIMSQVQHKAGDQSVQRVSCAELAGFIRQLVRNAKDRLVNNALTCQQTPEILKIFVQLPLKWSN